MVFNPSEPKRRKYTGEDRERFFVVLDRTGVVSGAARELGFGLAVCYRWAREGAGDRGAEEPPRGRRSTYPRATKELLLEAVRRGSGTAAAARSLGLSPKIAYQWVWKAGLTHSRPSGPGRREEYLRLRASGASQTRAAAAVGVNVRIGRDWDKGIRHSGGRRVHPDGGIRQYKRGMNTPTTMTAGPGIAALEKSIDPRFLSLQERETIRDMRAAGASMRAVATALGRSASTVSRELSRNSDPVRGYQPYAAHRKASSRRPRPRKGKLARCERLRGHVQSKLEVRLSPEQISRTLVRDFPDDQEMRVSPETIYQALYVQGRGGLRRELAAALRTGRARRKPQRTGTERVSRFADPMVMISDRPAEVQDRAVPGHWEGDLITGAYNQSAIGTLVERSTRYVMLLHLPNGHTAEDVRKALVETISTMPAHLRGSLTWDQGAEMAAHKSFTLATGMPVYFCDPASPWQRGSNENTNGLLRQYFPKGTDLSVHGPEDLEHVAQELNARPRKTLGWDTPAERLRDLLTRT